MMNVKEIRRNVYNVVKNYSDAQVKVRKATSNEPWGPSSTLMGEIADLTYNVVAFSEIMQIIWKRLNDHGKNWRHVYKALVLLEYLIKTGSEKVAQQCRDNLFAIQTLKDFQYFEESKDHGLSIREKSKMLVTLLKDEEKLKNERARALKAKERFAQSLSYLGSSSETSGDISRPSTSYHETLGSASESNGDNNPEIESARPHTVGEEELQLQLALAMSKEEAEQEERQRKNDDLRLKLALEESEKNSPSVVEQPKSAVDDLLSLNLGGAPEVGKPWGDSFGNGFAHEQNNPWQAKPAATDNGHHHFDDPWGGGGSSSATTTTTTNDPWGGEPIAAATKPPNDPWGGGSSSLPSSSLADFKSKPNDLIDIKQDSLRRTPESFLGPNSNLVNLDALVSSKQQSSTSPSNNPFAQAAPNTMSNPFQINKPSQPTINQLRAQSTTSSSSSVGGFGGSLGGNSAFMSITNDAFMAQQPQPPMLPPNVGPAAVVPGGPWASFQQPMMGGPQAGGQPNNPFAM